MLIDQRKVGTLKLSDFIKTCTGFTQLQQIQYHPHPERNPL